MREMCSSVLLLGVAAAAPEARKWASQVVDGDVPPEEFTLRQPPRWYQKLIFWRKHQGLRSLEGYLLSSDGHLDRVRTRPLDLRILKRWPSGSVPALPSGGPGNVDSWRGAPTAAYSGVINPENENRTGRFEVWEVPPIPKPQLQLPAPRPVTPPSFVAFHPDRLGVWLRFEGTAYERGCWTWTGDTDTSGYGRVTFDGRVEKTHIVMYCWANSLPMEEWKRRAKYEFATVDHNCGAFGGSPFGNTLCGNPLHLQLVTRALNVKLMHERRKNRFGRTGSLPRRNVP